CVFTALRCDRMKAWNLCSPIYTPAQFKEQAMNHSVLILTAFAIAGCSDAKRSAPVAAQNEQRTGAVVDRDNTAVNERDRASANKTPIDQNENQADIDITANIR